MRKILLIEREISETLLDGVVVHINELGCTICIAWSKVVIGYSNILKGLSSASLNEREFGTTILMWSILHDMIR